MRRYTLAAVTALLVLTPWHRAVRADAPLYTVQNLGSFNGLVPTINGINASGQVVGNVPINGSQAVRYTDGIGWRALPGLDNSFSFAFGINASGDVVGYHVTALGEFRAFRYQDGVGVTDIEPFAGGSMTFGYAINDAGDVVGFSDSVNGVQPFRAAAGVDPEVLPALPGGSGFACGINNAGQVAGNSSVPSGVQHGMRLDPGAASPLEILSPDGAARSVTTCAIDGAGRIAGQADRNGGASHAVRFTDAGGTLDLDTFGSSMSNVESIAAGVSAGWYTLADGFSTHAFAHRDADGSFDLNTRIDTPGWVLALAKGVNQNGVIAGEGTFNGAPAVFRLTPQEATDTTPPVISSVTANPSSIFPPSGQMVPVAVSVGATDDSGQAPVCTLSSITATGAVAGDTAITGPLSGSVRATGGRLYAFNVSCADAAGNAATSSVFVPVIPDSTAPTVTSLAATPSDLWPPDNRLVPVTVSVTATDDVDSAPVCALRSITGFTGTTDDAVITGQFSATLRAVSGRTYDLNVQCADAAGNAVVATTHVVVPADTTAPSITSLSAAPSSIWPANGKWVAVSIAVSATDDVDASPVCALNSISGAPASDYVITGKFSAKVRAERNANGSVRTYLFEVGCRDRAGNTELGAVSVSVGKDVPSYVYYWNHRLRLYLQRHHGRNGRG